MGERALQDGFFEMVTEKVQGIAFTFSALEIGKSIKCCTFVIKQEEPPLKSGAGCVKGDFQARFRENVRVKFPRVTRL